MRSLAVVVLLLLVAGCGGAEAPPKTVKVEGVVNHKGQPLTKGKVTLHPAAPPAEGQTQRPSVGQIGADGTFTLSTFAKDDGVMPGDYKITVESQEAEVTMEEYNEGKRPTSVIPEKYRATQTSGLTTTIPDQEEPFQLTVDLKE